MRRVRRFQNSHGNFSVHTHSADTLGGSDQPTFPPVYACSPSGVRRCVQTCQSPHGWLPSQSALAGVMPRRRIFSASVRICFVVAQWLGGAVGLL